MKHKYMTCSWWDEGRGEDRQLFPTLKKAREYAIWDTGRDGTATEVYIEYVEEGIDTELYGEGMWNVEIWCHTVGHIRTVFKGRT